MTSNYTFLKTKKDGYCLKNGSDCVATGIMHPERYAELVKEWELRESMGIGVPHTRSMILFDILLASNIKKIRLAAPNEGKRRSGRSQIESLARKGIPIIAIANGYIYTIGEAAGEKASSVEFGEGEDAETLARFCVSAASYRAATSESPRPISLAM